MTRTFFCEQVGDREHTMRSRCTCALDGMCLEHSHFIDDPGDRRLVADRDYYVTVCRSCMSASCWHGELMCDRSRLAGTTRELASVLRRMGVEHADHFSIERLLEVCGQVDYAD